MEAESIPNAYWKSYSGTLVAAEEAARDHGSPQVVTGTDVTHQGGCWG